MMKEFYGGIKQSPMHMPSGWKALLEQDWQEELESQCCDTGSCTLLGATQSFLWLEVLARENGLCTYMSSYMGGYVYRRLQSKLAASGRSWDWPRGRRDRHEYVTCNLLYTFYHVAYSLLGKYAVWSILKSLWHRHLKALLFVRWNSTNLVQDYSVCSLSTDCCLI